MGDEFKIIEHADIAMDDNLVCEPVVEEVVETEAITLATADGQIVRVISKEQYERLLAAAGKQKTYRCDTCKNFHQSGCVRAALQFAVGAGWLYQFQVDEM